MKEELKLKSGRSLCMDMPDFEVASDLNDAFLAELKAVNIDLGNLAGMLDANADLSELLKDPKFINTLKNAICQLLGSKSFRKILFACMSRSTLDGEKITPETFQQAREDYVPVAWEVTRLTLTPFIQSLLSLFTIRTGAPTVSPK